VGSIVYVGEKIYEKNILQAKQLIRQGNIFEHSATNEQKLLKPSPGQTIPVTSLAPRYTSKCYFGTRHCPWERHRLMAHQCY
jgi:hypothetical protein